MFFKSHGDFLISENLKIWQNFEWLNKIKYKVAYLCGNIKFICHFLPSCAKIVAFGAQIEKYFDVFGAQIDFVARKFLAIGLNFQNPDGLKI
jgi:hypothetical protein